MGAVGSCSSGACAGLAEDVRALQSATAQAGASVAMMDAALQLQQATFDALNQQLAAAQTGVGTRLDARA